MSCTMYFFFPSVFLFGAATAAGMEGTSPECSFEIPAASRECIIIGISPCHDFGDPNNLHRRAMLCYIQQVSCNSKMINQQRKQYKEKQKIVLGTSSSISCKQARYTKEGTSC